MSVQYNTPVNTNGTISLQTKLNTGTFQPAGNRTNFNMKHARREYHVHIHCKIIFKFQIVELIIIKKKSRQ